MIHLNVRNKILCGRNKYLTTKSIDTPNKIRKHYRNKYIVQCKHIYFTPKIWFAASFPSVGIIVVRIMTYHSHHEIIISKAPIIHYAYCVHIIILSRNMWRGGMRASHGRTVVVKTLRLNKKSVEFDRLHFLWPLRLSHQRK